MVVDEQEKVLLVAGYTAYQSRVEVVVVAVVCRHNLIRIQSDEKCAKGD